MSDNANATNSAQPSAPVQAPAQTSAPTENQNVAQQPQEQAQAQGQSVENQTTAPNTQQTENKEVNDVTDFASAYDNVETQEQPQEQQQNVVPEKYVLTTADGNELSAENLQGFSDIFKKSGLSQEQAQAMFSAYETEMKGVLAQQTEGFNKLKADWVAKVKADRELGGQNFNTTKMNIGRVMERFGNSELKQYLNQSGLGFNPDFVRFINKVGAALGNDTNFVDGKGGAPTEAEKQRLSIKALYPNSPELWGGR